MTKHPSPTPARVAAPQVTAPQVKAPLVSARARFRAARLAGTVAVSLLLAGCQTELYNSLPEQDANDMLAILLQNGLGATKTQAKDGTNTVTVEQSQFASAVDLLRAHGLPRKKFSSIGEVFQPTGLIASPVQEQARFLWALGQELSATVSQIDGVLTARVQVVLPDNDLLKRDPTPSSASVFVRYDEASQVAGLVSQIKMLVANSVQGLDYAKVSVVLVPVPHSEPPPHPAEPATPWPSLPAAVGAGGLATLLALLLAFRTTLTTRLRQIKPTQEPAE